jgi:hypothetical protein
MLNNLSAVIEPEDVDARPIGIAGPFLSANARRRIALRQ